MQDAFPAPTARRAVLRSLAAASACLPAWLGAQRGFAWTVVKIDGRDYITAQNIRDFYRFTSLSSAGNTLVFRSPQIEMRIVAGSDRLFINGVLFRLSYRLQSRDGNHLFSRIDFAKLIDPVLRPSHIATAKPFTTVVVDPGHGGHDSGTPSVLGTHEKTYTLSLGLYLKRELERRSFRVRMTRTGDTYPSLGERVRFANRVPDSVFISLHFNNGNGSRSANGVETYALSPRGSGTHNDGGPDGRSLLGNARDSENIALATAIHARILKNTRAEDRGIKRDRFYVLAGIHRPAVLVEGGFLSNREEARKVHSESYRALIGTGIADACVAYRNALQRR